MTSVTPSRRHCSTSVVTSAIRFGHPRADEASLAGRSRPSWTRARHRGLARVLITCDDDNVGSARVIEVNGGVLEYIDILLADPPAGTGSSSRKTSQAPSRCSARFPRGTPSGSRSTNDPFFEPGSSITNVQSYQFRLSTIRYEEGRLMRQPSSIQEPS